MIKSYGLHWHEKHISWGRRGGEAGSLLGCASRKDNANEVDFSQQRGIYVLYADYDLVYIGQTGARNNRLLSRLRSHKNDHLSERWNRFSWFGLLRVKNTHELALDAQSVNVTVDIALNILEAVSIAISEPKLNLQRGKWSEATQYYQYHVRDEGLEDYAEEEEELE